jgi:KaiC/GvpD/RAD55 family RecA-like ATPase
MPRRVHTGVPGLDDLLEGGFLEGQTVLLTGPTGTGKTTFCAQFLMEGVKNGEPGLLVTIGEGKKHILDYMKGFGWDLKALVSNNRLGLLDVTPMPRGPEGKFYVTDKPSLEFNLDNVTGLVLGEIERLKVRRVVLDSVSAMLLAVWEPFRLRHELLAVVDMLERSGCTALLTAERLGPESHADLLGFVTHGLIELDYPRLKNEHVRTLTVRKMRGTHHDQGVFLYEIGKQGLKVTSRAEYLD